MIKKYLWIAVLIFGFSSCEEAPNNFSTQANAFLNAIDGSSYTGISTTDWNKHTFESYGTAISETGPPPNDPLIFQNTKDSGASTTEGVYRIRMTDTGKLGDYVGIILINGGGQLGRTAAVDSESALTGEWDGATTFANRN